MRLTLGQIKPTVARVIGSSTTHARVTSYINEACSRLIKRGNWVGTTARYRCCVNEAKLTWPRRVEAILKASVCRDPIPIASQWYEFATAGPGIVHDDDQIGLTLSDMGEACSFNDINADGHTLRVISMESEAAGARVLLQGYDDSAQWIRTLDGSTWVEGEYVAISAIATNSTLTWSNLVGAVKPVTNGNVWLYQYDPVTAIQRPLAMWEPDETVPMYRRSRIAGLDTVGACPDDDCCADTTTKVNVIAKLRHIDASADNDYVSVPNAAAIKLMVMSIDKEEKNLFAEAAIYARMALTELESELVNHHGGGAAPQYDVQHPETWGAGAVESAL